MCTQDRREVEFLKRELFRAGIRTEVRTNPVAAALGVSRLELWLPNDNDYADASRQCTVIRNHVAEHGLPKVLNGDGEPDEDLFENERPVITTSVVDVEPLPPAGSDEVKTKKKRERRASELEQARALLEQEVEEVLARETELAAKCASLHDRVKHLSDSLEESKAKHAEEARGRAAAEKKAAEISDLKAALEKEMAERRSLEEKLQRETRRAEEELSREKTARIAAEENAAKLTAARDSLAQQLAENTRQHQELQSELDQEQEQLQAYLGSLNSLRSKLQAKKRQ